MGLLEFAASLDWSAIVTGIGGGALVYFGTRYTARASRDASKYSANVSAADAVSSGYSRLNDDLWETIRDLRKRVDALERDMRELRGQYSASVRFIRHLLAILGVNGLTPPPSRR